MSLRSPWLMFAAILALSASLGAAAPAVAPNILIWKPQFTNSTTGDALLADLAVLGEDAAIDEDLFAYSPDLTAHEIVMCVGGVEPYGHLISATEGAALDSYVQGGGLLYLECGDCFNYDPEVSGAYNVRPIFGLMDGSDGDGVFFGDVVGIGPLGDFGFDFNYLGEPSVLDILEPMTSTAILRKESNENVHAVFHAAYGDGRSIAFSVEYGGLYNFWSATAQEHTPRQQLLSALLRLLRSGVATAVPDLAPSTTVTLHPATPNPFATGTTIRYDLTTAARVRLTVFDVAGRVVRTLADRREERGSHSAQWDGRNATGERVASGVYFFALDAGENTSRVVRRVVVLK